MAAHRPGTRKRSCGRLPLKSRRSARRWKRGRAPRTPSRPIRRMSSYVRYSLTMIRLDERENRDGFRAGRLEPLVRANRPGRSSRGDRRRETDSDETRTRKRPQAVPQEVRRTSATRSRERERSTDGRVGQPIERSLDRQRYTRHCHRLELPRLVPCLSTSHDRACEGTRVKCPSPSLEELRRPSSRRLSCRLLPERLTVRLRSKARPTTLLRHAGTRIFLPPSWGACRRAPRPQPQARQSKDAANMSGCARISPRRRSAMVREYMRGSRLRGHGDGSAAGVPLRVPAEPMYGFHGHACGAFPRKVNGP